MTLNLDIAQFYISTDEDLLFKLVFTNRSFTGRTLNMKIRERSSNALKVTLVDPATRLIVSSSGPIAGVDPDPPAGNEVTASLLMAGMAGWATGDYEADLLDVTGGAATRICPVRFTYDQPGRLVLGVEGNKATITISADNQAIVTSIGGVGIPGPSNQIEIGEVTTLPTGENATAEMEGSAPNQTLNLGLPRGAVGDKGWAPVFANKADGSRIVMQVTDWVGGQGTKPATGDYVGPTGLVSTAAAAVDIRGAIGSLGAVQARLSLSATLPVTDADIAAASLIYLHPVGGNYLPIWNGSQMIYTAIPNILSLELDGDTGHFGYHAAGFNFDLFAALIGGVLRFGTASSWALGAVASPNPDTERATGTNSSELEWVQGIPVNKNAITMRIGSLAGDTTVLAARRGTYLGTFRATANGKATDTQRQRLLFNVYNQAARVLRRVEATSAWTVPNATWRQTNGSALNQVEIINGLAGGLATGNLTANHVSSSATEYDGMIGVGYESLVPAEFAEFTFRQRRGSSSVAFSRSLGLGYRQIKMLESGDNAATPYFRAPVTLVGQVIQ